MLRFAYNTAGCVHHRLNDALELMAEAGYSGVTLTLGWHHFDPLAEDIEAKAADLAERLRDLDLAVALDTRIGFRLDPREPDEPSLIHPSEEGRQQCLDALKRAVRIGALCEAESITVVAGRPRRAVSQGNAALWLIDGLTQVADAGAAAGVAVGLQPEPGHMVGSLDDFVAVREALKQATDAPLGLALNLSHCHARNDRDPSFAVKEFAAVLSSVSIADARRDAAAPLPFGAGDMNIAAVLGALEDVAYERLVSVDLPGESARAHRAIGDSYDWLQENLPSD